MGYWSRRALAAAAGWLVVASVSCAGKSVQGSATDASRGGSSTTITAGAGGDGEPASECLYDGVRYLPGQTFGACAQCTCVADLGVVCGHAVCSTGGAPSGRGGGGGGGAGAQSGGASTPGGGGVTVAVGGAADEPAQCEYADVETLCVVGKPSGDAQDFVAGMPFVVSRHAGGCHSSSCTNIGDSSCYAISSERRYWVSPSVCLVTQGETCTDDCGGPGDALCDLGPLTEGEYTVGLSGPPFPTITFTVPSHVIGGLCVTNARP